MELEEDEDIDQLRNDDIILVVMHEHEQAALSRENTDQVTLPGSQSMIPCPSCPSYCLRYPLGS